MKANFGKKSHEGMIMTVEEEEIKRRKKEKKKKKKILTELIENRVLVR